MRGYLCRRATREEPKSREGPWRLLSRVLPKRIWVRRRRLLHTVQPEKPINLARNRTWRTFLSPSSEPMEDSRGRRHVGNDLRNRKDPGVNAFSIYAPQRQSGLYRSLLRVVREPDTEIAMAGGYSLQTGAGVVRRRARDLSKPVITPGKGSNSRKH